MPKQIKQIAFSGIQRNTTDQDSKDGALLECINFRYKDGAWRGVGDKISTELKFNLANETAESFYFHPALPDNTFVYHNITNDTIDTVLFNSSGDGTPASALSLSNGEVFDRFAHMNNVLLVFTSLNRYILYWDKVTLAYVDISSMPVPVVNIGQEDALYNIPDIPNNTNGNTYVPGTRAELLHHLWPYLYSELLYKSGTKLTDGYFEGFVMIRVAYRLWDGTYINHSQPYIVHVGYNPSNRPFVEIIGSDSEGTTYDSSLSGLYLSKPIIYIDFPESDVIIMKNLLRLRIVESIDVFSTRPVSAIDYEQDTDKWVAYSTGSNFDGLYYIPFATERISKIIEDNQFYKVHSFLFSDLTTQATHHDGVTGSYYNNLRVYSTLDYSKEISANELLPIDSFSHHKLLAKCDFEYNSKLHIGDVSVVLPGSQNQLYHSIMMIAEEAEGKTNGYEFVDVIDTDIKTVYFPSVSTPSALPAGVVLYQQVWIKTDEGVKIVTTEQSKTLTDVATTPHIPVSYNYFAYTNGSNYRLHLNPIVSYPDYRATKIRYYYTYLGVKYYLAEINLKPYEGKNIAAYISDFTDGGLWLLNGNGTFAPKYIALTIGADAVLTDDPDDDTLYEDRNRVQVSELHNVFSWPSSYSYRFGLVQNRVKDISATQQGMSDSAFGQYPLYILSEAGIFALQSGQGEVLYQSSQIVSNLILVSRGALVQIPGGIVFATAENVYFLSGSQSVVLSTSATGQIQNKLLDSDVFQDAVSGSNLPDILDNLSHYITFLDYIGSGINMLHDVFNNEVIISSPDYQYSYVYSIINKVWSTRTELFNYAMIISGRVLGIKKHDHGQEEYQTTELFYADTEELEARSANCPYALLQTRPFRLESDNPKRIDKLRLAAEYASYESDKGVKEYAVFQIWGSNDNVTYDCLSYIQSVRARDILLSRLLGNYKYFVVVFGCERLNATIKDLQLIFSERFGKLLI